MKKRILFIGTHGQKNIGDELLLSTFIHHIHNKVGKIYVNSYLPDETKRYLSDYDVETFNTSGSKFLIFKYLIRCDAVVFGGGSIIKELYTAYGGKKYGTLNVIRALTATAKIFRKPIYMSHIGVGPINTKKGMDIAREILNRVSFTSVRDLESYELIEEIAPKSKYALASDAVFSLESSFFSEKTLSKKRDSVLTVGLNLCRNIQNNENWEKFIEQLQVDLIRIGGEYREVRFVGIPMQSNVENNNDYLVLESLKENLLRTDPSLNITIKKTETYLDVAKILSECDILMAERLHILIIASIMNIPIVPMEYDPKVRAIMHDLSVRDFAIDINSDIPNGIFFEKFKKRMDEKTSYGSLKSLRSKSRSAFAKLINYLT